MDVKVFYDDFGDTLTVWFDDPALEDFSQDAGDDVVVMRSKEGASLGFEMLNIRSGGERLFSFSSHLSEQI